MLKRFALAVTVACLFTPVAVAGEGCDCSNGCPLAQEAVHHMASGSEAVLASKIVQKDYVKFVLANLKLI